MIELLSPSITRTETVDGFVLESTTPLGTPASRVGDWLARWARETPDATYLAERRGDAWQRTSYAEALQRVKAIGAALLDRGATPDRPILILSDNSVDHALLALGAMHVGLVAAPVSPAYSLQSTRFERLKHVTSQLQPGFVFADDARYDDALDVVGVERIRIDDLRGGVESVPSDAATIAKVLFTSGSTGAPRGVVNTQRMLTSSQESLATCWPFLEERAPVVVDWLPWSHTFGGNHNFFLVLRNGGSLYVDRGRPAPGLIETTLANMADVGPSLWFNVPRGFDHAVTILERDAALARRVLRNVDVIFYAAAALSPTTRTRLEEVARKAGREDIFFTAAWGSTETSPLATSAHYPTRTTGILGVPIPGVSLKLARVQDRHELRVKGPNVTPGYWTPGGVIEPIALDADGYLPIGDAGVLADPDDANAGVVFAGRISENFKLSSGTWVHVAEVRLALVDALAPLVIDAVLAGHDRDAIVAIVFPVGKVAPDELRAKLDAFNVGRASSQRVERVLVAREPLSLDDGETTDKGYTNQRRVLERRSADVERLLASGETVVD